MAGNRVHKFGTILSRVEGLLRSGAISEESAPIWLSVYRAFPPHIEPKLSRPIPDQHIRDIVYPEDFIRARFYSTFGSVGLIDNLNQISKNYKSVSQTFIDRYIQIAAKNQDLNDDQLFDKTTQTLIEEGIRLSKGSDKQTVRIDKSHESSQRSGRSRPSAAEIALSEDI